MHIDAHLKTKKKLPSFFKFLKKNEKMILFVLVSQRPLIFLFLRKKSAQIFWWNLLNQTRSFLFGVFAARC